MNKRAVIKISLVIVCCALIALVLFFSMIQTPKVKAEDKSIDLQIAKDDCKSKGCFEGTESLNITYQIADIGNQKYTPFCIFDKDTVQQDAYLEYFTAWEEDVPDYECIDTGTINETSGEPLQECTQTGSHKETKEGWLKFEGEKTLEKNSDIYLSVTSGNCHLPFKLTYSGSSSPSDITLDTSLITSYFNFASDGKAVDVVPSIKIGAISLMMGKMAWWNQSDVWNVSQAAGASNPHGITTNGTDWWFVDITANYVYHLNRTLGVVPDGFATSQVGCGAPRGLYYNGSALLSLNDSGDALCVMSLTGVGLGGNGLRIRSITCPSVCGSNEYMNSLGGNGSDIWISTGNTQTEVGYAGFIYHLGSNFQNMSDGFSTGSQGCNKSRGIVTNNTDFFVVCGNNDFMYHFNRTGGNVTDGFNLSAGGMDEPADSTIYPNLDYSTPITYTDFWITDQTYSLVYHFYQPNYNPTPANEFQGDDAILQGIANSTANLSTNYLSQQIYTINYTGQQKLGRFDVVAVSGNQRWAFNYISTDENTSNFTYMVNITPVLYVWEASSLNYTQIQQQVTIFINSTKQ